MKVTFTSHAQYRLMERKVSFVDARDTVLKPDLLLTEGGLLRARKKSAGKILEVVYKYDKSSIVIITAYYL